MTDKWGIIPRICALLAVLLLHGCYKPVNQPVIIYQPRPLPSALLTSYRIIGKSVQQRPIISTILGQGHDVIFIMATIHGNEPAGTTLLLRLAKYLQQNPQWLKTRTVVLLPIANPDGMAAGSRYNVRGVDLNRNFATANRLENQRSGITPLSEPEARIIEQLIRQYAPDRIVSIHQPLACIDYDGPARELASRLSEYCDLPVKKLGARPGSLGSYAGLTLHIPIITLELPPGAHRLDGQSLWDKYGPTLIAAVAYPESIN